METDKKRAKTYITLIKKGLVKAHKEHLRICAEKAELMEQIAFPQPNTYPKLKAVNAEHLNLIERLLRGSKNFLNTVQRRPELWQNAKEELSSEGSPLFRSTLTFLIENLEELHAQLQSQKAILAKPEPDATPLQASYDHEQRIIGTLTKQAEKYVKLIKAKNYPLLAGLAAALVVTAGSFAVGDLEPLTNFLTFTTVGSGLAGVWWYKVVEAIVEGLQEKTPGFAKPA